MKKFLPTILFLALNPLSAFAFNQSAYLVNTTDNVLDKVFCDNPTDNIIPWVDNDRISDGFSCNSGGGITFLELFDYFSTIGTYRIIECSIGNCGDSGELSDARDDENYVGEALLTFSDLSGAKIGVLFGRSGESRDIVSGGGSVALASLGFVSTDTFSGIFPYLMLSMGVFVGFLVIQKIIMIFGSFTGEKVRVDKEQAEWSGRGLMEKEVREFKKKKRSRIKRGLE